MLDFSQIVGFVWDNGNARKGERQRGIFIARAEQVFFNAPLLVLASTTHSAQELRHYALGPTDAGRPLHISCLRCEKQKPSSGGSQRAICTGRSE